MGKEEIGNFYYLIGDFTEMLLNSSPLLKDFSLNLIGCRGNIKSEFSKKKVCFSRKSRLKVTYMFMSLTNRLVVLFIAVLLQIF